MIKSPLSARGGNGWGTSMMPDGLFSFRRSLRRTIRPFDESFLCTAVDDGLGSAAIRTAPRSLPRNKHALVLYRALTGASPLVTVLCHHSASGWKTLARFTSADGLSVPSASGWRTLLPDRHCLCSPRPLLSSHHDCLSNAGALI
jgi:hypothetical protein